MWQISAGLGLALALTLGSFKLYHDKKEAETKAFYLQLEQSIQNQKVLEGTIESQNEVIRIKKTFARHDLNVLSIRKPKLIEKIINRGTGDVLNDLKTITNPNQFDEVGPPILTSSG